MFHPISLHTHSIRKLLAHCFAIHTSVVFQLRTPTTTSSFGGITVSRRPVLSVRRRIASTPASNIANELTTPETHTTTHSKFIRTRSRPATLTTTAASSLSSSATTTTAYQSAATVFKNYNHKNYLSTKLKTSKYPNSATVANAPATSKPVTSVSEPSKPFATSANDITQRLAPSGANSFRRKFQARRFTTTTAANAVDQATETPRTQNPLFKRRFSLTTAVPSLLTVTTAVSTLRSEGIATTVPSDVLSSTLYEEVHVPDDATDQIAKSSIHTSRFKKITNGDEDEEDVLSALSALTNASAQSGPTHAKNFNTNIEEALARRPITTTTSSTVSAANELLQVTTRRSSKTRGRPQKDTPIPAPAGIKRRRPHKYSADPEPFNRLEASKNRKTTQQRTDDYDYYDDEDMPVVGKSQGQLKVILHGRGIIECLDQGNFPHPLSCRKFISCAKFETGGVVGWEYTCPKGLSYDPVGGMCNWAAGLGCKE